MTGTMDRRRAELKKRLKRLGITQDAIAERAGCTRTYVNHYLAGRRSPERLRRVIDLMIAEKRVA